MIAIPSAPAVTNSYNEVLYRPMLVEDELTAKENLMGTLVLLLEALSAHRKTVAAIC